MKPFLTFITVLISLVSLASTVKVLLKLPGNSDTSTFLETGDIDILIGSDWVLTISKNEQIVIKENQIGKENMSWYHWNNVESFEFQLFTEISSKLTNLDELVNSTDSWIRVKNFKITETGPETFKATVKCAEDVLLKKVINNDLTIYGIGSIRSVQTSNWTLLIKYTQGIRKLDDNERNATDSAVNHDQHCWLESGELEFTLTVNYDLINSSESETIMYWLRAKYVSNEKFTDSTGVVISVTINDQISLIKKNMFINKTFQGYLDSSKSILVLVLHNKSEIAELQDAYKNTTLPVLQLSTETSSSSAPREEVMIDFKCQHKTVLDETLILIFNYWNAISDGKSITYSIGTGEQKKISVSRCYLAYSNAFVPFAIANIMWDQSTSIGSIWIEKVWDNEERKYVVPKSSNLFNKIKRKTLFNVTRRTAADGKAPILSFNHKQWATVQCLTSKHNLFTGQVTIDISFGVKIRLEVKTDNDANSVPHVCIGFFNLSNRLLTLTTTNQIKVFDDFSTNFSTTRIHFTYQLLTDLLKRYKTVPETSVNEEGVSQATFYVVQAYSSVNVTKSVFVGAIRQYSCKLYT